MCSKGVVVAVHVVFYTHLMAGFRPVFDSRVWRCLVFSRLLSTSSLRSVERGVNKVELLGRVGSVPKEFNNAESGKRLISFPLGTDTVYKEKDDNGFENRKVTTTWHNINIFRPYLQDFVLNYVQKGSRVYLSGRIQYSKYTDSGGSEKFVTRIVADDLIHLQRPRSASDQEMFRSQSGDDAPTSEAEPSPNENETL